MSYQVRPRVPQNMLKLIVRVDHSAKGFRGGFDYDHTGASVLSEESTLRLCCRSELLLESVVVDLLGLLILCDSLILIINYLD